MTHYPRRRLSLAMHEERVQAYHETSSDDEAAAKLKISKAAFVQWRHTHGFPSKREQKRPMQGADHEGRLRAYHATWTDEEAARLAKVGLDAFRKWRQTEGLPAKGVWTSKPEEKHRRRVIRASKSDQQAADTLGMSRQALTQWRQSRNIKRPRK